MDTDQLIARLRDLHERLGIDIFQAETDTIQFRFLSPPKEPRALAEELYEFCPDIVDQDCGSVEALAQGLEHRLQRLTLRLQVGGDGFRQRVDL